MKQFKKLAAPLLAAALLMGTAACGGGGATSSAGTSSPDSSSPSADAVTFTVTADVTGDRAPYVERFAQLVEEKTEGRYTASIIAAGSLGTGSDMAQMLQMGTLDVLMSDDMTMDGVLDGALGFAWLPGLVADYEEADAYYNNAHYHLRLYLRRAVHGYRSWCCQLRLWNLIFLCSEDYR